MNFYIFQLAIVLLLLFINPSCLHISSSIRYIPVYVGFLLMFFGAGFSQYLQIKTEDKWLPPYVKIYMHYMIIVCAIIVPYCIFQIWLIIQFSWIESGINKTFPWTILFLIFVPLILIYELLILWTHKSIKPYTNTLYCLITTDGEDIDHEMKKICNAAKIIEIKEIFPPRTRIQYLRDGKKIVELVKNPYRPKHMDIFVFHSKESITKQISDRFHQKKKEKA